MTIYVKLLFIFGLFYSKCIIFASDLELLFGSFPLQNYKKKVEYKIKNQNFKI